MERFMEMAKTKIILFFAAAALLTSCGGDRFTWQKFPMDGHRTGVKAANADNVAEALGVVDDSVYTAPNGKQFLRGSATYAAASDMIAVQPEMAGLKKVIAHSAKEMTQTWPDGDLANWVVDRLMADVAATTGRKVDVAITNSGGIRVDMPCGDVVLDDIVSMFPFKNYLCYVGLKGKDLLDIFTQMAATRVQPVAGVKLVVEDGKVDTLLVGGKPIDEDKVYGLATIDFLLDGGDNLNLAKNAVELVVTDKKVVDSMLPYVLEYEKEGRLIESSSDGRVVIRGGKRND